MRLLYTPTTKVASTTIKWMLAEAEGTLNLDMIPRLLSAIVHRSQTIHNQHVHGLTRLITLPKPEIEEVLTSPEWIRLAAIRDPIARSYSAWENRIFTGASGRVTDVQRLAPDIIVNGQIDMTASFATFADALATQTDCFMRDHHFVPQSTVVRRDAINYDMLVRVDEPGGMDLIANLFSSRSGKQVVPQRHNESIGVPLRQACSQKSAELIERVYASDYDSFGFARGKYPALPDHFMLSTTETRLVMLMRQSVERVNSVSRTAQSKMSARYGWRQVRKAGLRKLSFGRLYTTRRENSL